MATMTTTWPIKTIRPEVDGWDPGDLDLGTQREHWGQDRLLDTWERPLKMLGWAMTLLAVVLLSLHL